MLLHLAGIKHGKHIRKLKVRQPAGIHKATPRTQHVEALGKSDSLCDLRNIFHQKSSAFKPLSVHCMALQLALHTGFELLTCCVHC